MRITKSEIFMRTWHSSMSATSQGAFVVIPEIARGDISDIIKKGEMKMKKRNQKGFTIMEMLIVVAIIAILVAIAIPTFNNALTKSKEAADVANIRAAYAEVMLDYMMDGKKPTKADVTKKIGTLNDNTALKVEDTQITYTAKELKNSADGSTTFKWSLTETPAATPPAGTGGAGGGK